MDYTKQINKVLDFITLNLDKPITVAKLADVAGLSPYHFHRIFCDQMGESLAKFVNRKRMEKAARELMRCEDITIAEIADSTGYGSIAVFCRNFKAYFGETATEYRRKNSEQNSKNHQSDSINQNNIYLLGQYLCPYKTIKKGDTIMTCKFEIKQLESRNVIYYRHLGAYNQMHESLNKLMQWAYPRGLVTTCPLLGAIYIDDPNITPVEKLQTDVFLVVDGDIKVDGAIGKHTINGGMYAVGHFEITITEYAEAWRSMCKLIAEHGCQSIDGFYHEYYLNNPGEHPENKHIVDICIPVKAV